jgi:hypothetical protein
MVEVPTGEAKKVDVFNCPVDTFEANGAAWLTMQDGETINTFLEAGRLSLEIHAEMPRMHVGCSKLPCDVRAVLRPAGVLLTHTQG